MEAQKVLARDPTTGEVVEVRVVQPEPSTAFVDGGSPATAAEAPFFTVDFGGVT